MGTWLDTKLSSWKVLDKTTVCVSDTAATMIRMMEYLPNDKEHNDCLNHFLQLSINDEILEKPEIKSIIINVRAVTNYTRQLKICLYIYSTVSLKITTNRLVSKEMRH